MFWVFGGGFFEVHFGSTSSVVNERQYCQRDISHSDRKNMLGTACLSTQCTVDKVISYTTSTALATSPGTSTLHRLCTSLPHFGIHHPLPISTWHLQCKQQHSVSLKHCCQARDGRKQQHPPNLLPPTHAHCIKCPNAVSQHHHQTWQAKKHTPPQP